MASVMAPDKRVWKVRRRWLPTRIELPRAKDLDPLEGAYAVQAFDSVSGFVLGLVAVLLLAVALIFVWPLLALAIELIAIVFLAVGALIGRVVFRRPWVVVATTDGPPAERLAWHVSGWRATGEAIEKVATALRSGPHPRPPG